MRSLQQLFHSEKSEQFEKEYYFNFSLSRSSNPLDRRKTKKRKTETVEFSQIVSKKAKILIKKSKKNREKADFSF